MEETPVLEMSRTEFMGIAEQCIVGLALDAAAIAQAKNFDQKIHRTQIIFMATEITEALEHVTASGNRDVDFACNIIARRMETLKLYQRRAKDHQDLSDVVDRDKLLEELGDTMLRILTYVGGNGWEKEFAAIMLAKNDANRYRPALHGKAF